MAKHRAIPKGYMTVGEVAKKIGVTVRTLQYYDKEGLLSPSAESEGGRRLYTDKDLVILHQIISLKSLGWILRLTVAHWNNILSKWQGGKQNERFFIRFSVTVEIGYTK